MKNPIRIASLKTLWRDVLIAIPVTALCFWQLGYYFAYGDPLEYLNYYQKMIHPDWLPQDYWISHTDSINIRTGFLLHVWLLETVIGLAGAFLLLHLMALWLLVFQTIRLGRFLTQHLNLYLPVWLVPLLLVFDPFYRKFNKAVAGNEIFENALIMSFYATPFMVWGLRELLRRRYAPAGLLFAYTTLIHLQLGGMALIAWSLLYLWDREKFGLRQWLIDHVKLIPLLALPVYVVLNLSISEAGDVVDPQFVWQGFIWRLGHHMDPMQFGAGKWETVAWKVLFILLLIWRLSKTTHSQAHQLADQIKKLLVVSVGLMGLALVGIVVFENLWVLKLQAFRLEYVYCIVGAVGLLSAIDWLAQSMTAARLKNSLRSWLLFVTVCGLLWAGSDYRSQQRLFSPLSERFFCMDAPGQNDKPLDRFLRKGKEMVAPGSVVLPTVNRNLQLALRPVWNIGVYFSRKMTPFRDSLWPEYRLRNDLVETFFRNPTPENLQKAMERQPVEYFITTKFIDWAELVVHEESYFILYKTPDSLLSQAKKDHHARLNSE